MGLRYTSKSGQVGEAAIITDRDGNTITIKVSKRKHVTKKGVRSGGDRYCLEIDFPGDIYNVQFVRVPPPKDAGDC